MDLFQARASERSSLREAMRREPRHWAEEADFNLGLIQPTGVLRGVVDGKAIPQSVARLLTEVSG